MTGDPATAAADVRCGQCGAPACWDPQARGQRCASCGAVTPVEPSPLSAGHTLQEASHRWPDRPRRPGSHHLSCRACGAVVDTAPGALTGACPFCGSDAVAEAEDDGRAFPPDAVLPFTVSREVARARYRTWLMGLWFRPSALARRAHLDSLSPVYVPFWAFDFQTRTDWRADYFDRSTTSLMGSGNPNAPGVWRGTAGEHDDELHGVLAQGSTGLPEALWRALEPFPLEDACAYDGRFLAGFAAEAARVQPLEAWQDARTRTEARQHLEAEARVPGDRVRRFSARTSFEGVSFRQVLLPMWVAAYRYRGRVFRFLVNGATGEVQGRAPWSWVKIGSTAAVVLALLAGAIWSLGVPLAEHAVAEHHQAWLRAHPQAARARPPAVAEWAPAFGLKPVDSAGAPLHVRRFVSHRASAEQGGAARRPDRLHTVPSGVPADIRPPPGTGAPPPPQAAP